MALNLSHVAVNCDLEIVTMNGDSTIVQRLKELGFYPSASIKIVRRMPFNGPSIVQVATTTVALRKVEADCIQVKEK